MCANHTPRFTASSPAPAAPPAVPSRCCCFQFGSSAGGSPTKSGSDGPRGPIHRRNCSVADFVNSYRSSVTTPPSPPPLSPPPLSPPPLSPPSSPPTPSVVVGSGDDGWSSNRAGRGGGGNSQHARNKRVTLRVAE